MEIAWAGLTRLVGSNPTLSVEPGQLGAQLPEPAPSLAVVGLRVRPRLLLAVEEAAADPLELGRGGEAADGR